MTWWRWAWLPCALACVASAQAVTVEFNSTGGATSTDGLHFYIEDTTKIQVKRLNNTGQVYSPTASPPNTGLDNGVFIRANGKVYGPSHAVGGGFTPSGGMYSAYSIGAVSPPNPSSPGVQQTATGSFGIAAGPQVTIVWKYTTPLDFLTAEVTLTIPPSYPVSAANPVRYYHVVDTYLGGSDSGCGVSFVDANGKRLIGTYPPASGTTCPSNTGIPAGVSVVESFRERSGMSFSRYCAAAWDSFYVNGSPNCSILQAAVMSNAVTTTYQDTGIGIEFDFTTAGTYSFSYDFVVGSPLVPPYDHLEIRHDGAATLCPENVTVLACTSSAVPCPVANLVNSGTLTANLTVSPTTPAVTITPTPFTLGSSGTTATVTLQGTAPGGTYTLGTSNPSSVPLNGTRCWNQTTSTQSCTFVVNNTSCVANFECIETGVAYTNLTATPAGRNPLYTKPTNTNFRFDVVALQSGGTQAATYAASANVTVELFDDNASPQPACSAYTNPVASQAITFAVADGGRKTVPLNFNLTKAYRKLRCRVRDANMSPNVVGCSSDDFAVRPRSFAVAANLGGATLKAGSNFTLSADSGVTAAYDGTPTVVAANLRDHNNALAGTLTGAFTAGNGATATGTFQYHDVGTIGFLSDAVIDTGYTAIDQPNDCVAGSTSNTPDASGKYGCNIGSTATGPFGRFCPDHFTLAATLTPACNGFTYMDQPGLGIALTLSARSLNGAITSRYTAGYGFLGTFSITGDNAGTAVPVSRLNPGLPAFVWSAGAYTVNSATTKFTRNATPDGTYESFALKANILTEPDGVAITGSALSNTTRMRFGRLRLSNVFGYAAPLRMPVEAQYWSGNSWVKNGDDNCTSLAAGNLPMSPTGWTLTAPGALASGGGLVTLTPTGFGSIRVCADLGGDNGVSCAATGAGLPWLQSKWPGAATFNNDPSAAATFGIYSPEGKRGVYSRELY